MVRHLMGAHEVPKDQARAQAESARLVAPSDRELDELLADALEIQAQIDGLPGLGLPAGVVEATRARWTQKLDELRAQIRQSSQ